MSHTSLILGEWQNLYKSISKTQPLALLDGHTLRISQVVATSRYKVDISIRQSALDSLEASLHKLEQELQAHKVIYGVNTGFGATADTRTKKTLELQRVLIRELHYGILPPGSRDPCHKLQNEHQYDLSLESGEQPSYLPWSWARAAILIRINSLIKGCSGVRPVVVQRMRDLLEHDIIPMIPLRGSISASGDLSPLSYIGGAIQGKSTIRILSKEGKHSYADQAFNDSNLEPILLQAKEGLAIVNGTAISTAAAALALYDTHILAVFAQISTAMSVEALNGTTESFHPFFSEMRPHPGQVEAARNIMSFLQGSKLTKINTGAESSLRQDRYSIRTSPQWVGPILEDLILAHQQISIECNSATDNPLLHPSGEFINGGNFQAKAVTSAMEKARQGIQSIGKMLFTQCTEIINPATSFGLPPNLVAEDPSISFIFKGTDLNIAALQSELGFLANPVGSHVQPAEQANQALNSLALISARYTHIANDVLTQLMAAHLIALCQALDLRAMHNQFLQLYRPQFIALVTEIYPPERNTLLGTSSIADDLPELLWDQLLKSFDSTVNMNSSDRFIAITKSLRSVLLDHSGYNQHLNFVTQLQNFTSTLSSSLEETWCANRDAYLVHGDATSVLGIASRKVYTYIRHSLEIPFLSTSVYQTPKHEEFNDEGSHNNAPTIGSYTGIVYRALKDGNLAEVGMEILKNSQV